MASPGTYISGAGHAGLLVWLLAGWGFAADPLPFEVATVSAISGEDFAALTAGSTPDPGLDIPDAPQVVEPDAAPELVLAPEPVAPVDPPAPVEAPVQELAPPEAPEPPAPVAEVQDAPPAPLQPPQEAIPLPQVTETPQAQTADRVAPDPVAPPPPDVDTAPEVETATAPAPDAAPTEAETEAAAPEETTTEIVTEADEPSGAVAVSLRPQVRPNRPTPPAAEPVEEVAASEAAADPAQDSTIDDLLAGIVADTGGQDLPEGPPLTGSEREGFRVAVNRCWNIDPGSEAARVTITVAFSLSQTGRVEGDIRQIGASGGSDAAVRAAYQTARRAILRCQGEGGYDLPAEKYSQWREVEIAFDPNGMRMR